MKGLLLKDLLILANQKKTILMIFILGIAMALAMQTASVISYFMMFGCILALGTFSYDEADNGYSFLFTLPVSRKTYVREKYLFMTGWTLICAVVGIICCSLLILTGLGKPGSGWQDIPEYFFPMLSLILVIIAVSVPLRIKYGSEKSRIVIYIIAGAGVLISLLITRLSDSFGAPVKAFLTGLDPAVILPVFLAFSVILVLISERITQRIIARKEY